MKGEPLRFIAGHQRRKTPIAWVVDPETGCWPWQRAVSGAGYAQCRIDGRLHYVHRLHWEERHGSLPCSQQLHHRCESRACVNPDHLEALDIRDHAGGAGHGKLALDDAREIRRLWSAGMQQRDIAARFGISRPYVSEIVNFKHWVV